MAKLMSDEFIPKQYDSELDFWRVPKGIAKHTELSWGAKVLYGVIYGHAHKTGEARPSYKALQKWMGNPSKATMQRWIKELVDMRLIRAIQRGRGISNVYRIKRSPLVGNMTQEEFEQAPNIVYAGPLVDEPVLVDSMTAFSYYLIELDDWEAKSVLPTDFPMPKCYEKGTASIGFAEQRRWNVIDRYLFESGKALSYEFEV